MNRAREEKISFWPASGSYSPLNQFDVLKSHSEKRGAILTIFGVGFLFRSFCE